MIMVKKIENLNFSNKVAFITGSGRGIGKALAESFASKKAKLVIISKSKNIYKTAEEINCKTHQKDILPFKGDISNYHFIKQSVDKTIEKWGTIDILINAAAILGTTEILPKTNVKKWVKTIHTNLIGTYLTMHEILPIMMSRRKGKIINFAGGGAAYSYPKFTAYASSKVAVVRLTETVAEEMLPYNIQVNVIAPGAVKTDLLEQVKLAGGKIKTQVTIDKPLDLVLFLASSYSNHITGRFIHSKDNYWNFPEKMKSDLYKLRRLAPR